MAEINVEIRRRKSMPGLIELILGLSMLAIGATPVLISQFVYMLTSEIYEFGDNDVEICSNSTNKTSLQNVIQSESTRFMMLINLATNGPSIITTIFLGSFSDRHGRKLTMLIPLTCSSLSYFLYSIFIFLKLDRKLFVLPGLINGVGGGWTAMYMAAFSYLSDRTTKESRSFRITVMEASTGVTITLSQILIGLSIKKFGYLYSFLFVQVTLISCLFITIVFLKESKGNKQDANAHTSILSYVKATFNLYIRPSEDGRRWRLNLCLIILFMGAYVNTGRTDICTYLLKDYPFCWRSDYIGYFMGGLMLLTYMGSLILTKLTGNVIGDKALILIGCLSGILSNLFMGFANSLSFLIISLITSLFMALIIPMVRSINSKLVSINEQGAMFAGIACIETLASLSGLIGNDTVYMATVDIFKPAAFVVCAGILAICFFVVSGYMWQEKRLTILQPQPLEETFY